MSGPARILACRPALVAIATLVIGGGLSGRAAQLPSQQQTQQPPPATGMIMGQVVDAATGKPVPGAIVSLVTATPNAATTGITNSADLVEMIQQTGPNVPNRIISDSDGRFVYRNLAKGRYGFSATANGYINGSYGQRRAGGPGVTVELETGEEASRCDVPHVESRDHHGFGARRSRRARRRRPGPIDAPHHRRGPGALGDIQPGGNGRPRHLPHPQPGARRLCDRRPAIVDFLPCLDRRRVSRGDDVRKHDHDDARPDVLQRPDAGFWRDPGRRSAYSKRPWDSAP